MYRYQRLIAASLLAYTVLLGTACTEFTNSRFGKISTDNHMQADGARYLALDVNGLTHQMIRVNNIDLSVATGGNGPVVLLWHGFLGNAYTYVDLAPELIQNYTLVVPDMRGYGGSTISDEGYDGETLAEDFAQLMAKLDHAKYHIMAFDMGAPPALLLTAKHADRVETLTYMEDPVLLPDIVADKVEMTRENTKFGGTWWWMVSQSPSMTEIIVKDKELEFVSWFYDNYTVVKNAVSPRSRRIFAEDLTGARDIHGWFGIYRDVFKTIDQTIPLQIDKVNTPILAIGGERSQGQTVEEFMKRVATDVQGHVMEGTAHFLINEKPKALAEVFTDFTTNSGS